MSTTIDRDSNPFSKNYKENTNEERMYLINGCIKAMDALEKFDILNTDFKKEPSIEDLIPKKLLEKNKELEEKLIEIYASYLKENLSIEKRINFLEHQVSFYKNLWKIDHEKLSRIKSNLNKIIAEV